MSSLDDLRFRIGTHKLARLNAAVFGFSQGTLFEVDGIAMRCVTFGCIAAAIGLAVDIGFLVLYSGSDAEKFEVSWLYANLSSFY